MRIRHLLILLVLPLLTAQSQVDFNRFFFDKTMRVDYHHIGSKGEERITLDKVLQEGPWPGSTVNLVDTLNLGLYLLRVYDVKSGLLLYSRGYSTVFNEWQTTAEAGRGVWKTFHESVRFPFPKRSVQVTISRRDDFLVFQQKFSVVVDPDDPTVVIAEEQYPPFEVVDLMDNGDMHHKVDILILGDGYAADEMDKFVADATHFNNVMFETSPFKERKTDFNVRALKVISPQSGIDLPDRNVWRNTALGSMYNTFGSPRYVLTEANRDLRDIAAAAPYDFLCILINDDRYGGGGIYQLYTTTYANEKNEGQAWQRDYVYVHEFGHSFGGLGDEYYSSSTGYDEFYPAGVEPWEPNVTRLMRVPHVKWQADVTPGIDIPTDWGKAEYDALRAELGTLDRLAEDYYAKRQPIFERMGEITKNPDLLGKVGAFEGAGYVSEGMYRPSLDCRMFSLSLTDFCPVCRAAIERQIDFYAK
ncbi:MAG: M64 family metallopeptidase [Bacteroidota bacterium]|nr:M64 family metallopeptidase [Bacteroidota bacterium]